MKPHRYLNVQSDETMTVLFRADDPSKVVVVDEHAHPLFGLRTPADLPEAVAMLGDDAVANLESCGFIQTSQGVSDDFQTLSSKPAKKITFRLFATLNCNSACRYCYQKHEGQRVMSAMDYESILAAVRKQAKKGLDVHIALFGGEPLLEASLLLLFLSSCRKECKRCGVEFSVSITTNGRLMADSILTEKLLQAGVKHFQITVDGTESAHNFTRPGLHGEATYGETLAGLANLQQQNESFVCIIRVNHNVLTFGFDALTEFHRDMSCFAGDSRFCVYHTAAADLGGNPERSLLLDDKSAKDTLARAKEMSIKSGLALHSDFYRPGGRVCYAALPNQFGVLPGGRLIKCSDDIYADINQVGHLTSAGDLELNENHDLWVSAEPEKKCGSCSVFPICQGRSCPLKRLQNGTRSCPDVKTDEMFFLRAIKSMMVRSKYQTKEA